MTHNKAIIIGRWWAGLFATLAAASAVSAFGFAWNANSQQAVIKERVDTQQSQLAALQGLPERMARVEETVKSTDKTTDAMRQEQQAISRKIDVLVQDRLDRGRPR